jgi:hypothetical protein
VPQLRDAGPSAPQSRSKWPCTSLPVLVCVPQPQQRRGLLVAAAQERRSIRPTKASSDDEPSGLFAVAAPALMGDHQKLISAASRPPAYGAAPIPTGTGGNPEAPTELLAPSRSRAATAARWLLLLVALGGGVFLLARHSKAVLEWQAGFVGQHRTLGARHFPWHSLFRSHVRDPGEQESSSALLSTCRGSSFASPPRYTRFWLVFCSVRVASQRVFAVQRIA